MKSSFFVTDLDHTFLRSDLSISRYSIEIWNQMSLKHSMGIATARSFTKAKELLKGVRFTAPLIFLDGALITDHLGRTIEVHAINKEIADAVIDIGSKLNIDPFIIGYAKGSFDEIFLYPRKLNIFQKNVLKGYRNDPRLLFNPNNKALHHNLKIVYFGEEEQMRNLSHRIKEELKSKIEAKLSPEKYGGGWFLTLLHPKGDKAHALRLILKSEGVNAKEVTVFGDSINDLGMFQLAGTSVAVANALEEVKKTARIVLPRTNDQDGVAHYLADLR